MSKSRPLAGFRMFWRMLGLARPLASVLVLAILLGVASSACVIVLPTLAASCVVWIALGQGIPFGLPLLAAILVMLVLACASLHFARRSYSGFLGLRLLAQLRNRIFEALRRLSPAQTSGPNYATLISTIADDVEQLEAFYTHALVPAAVALVVSVSMLVALARLHWALALTASVAYVLVGLVIPYVVARCALPLAKAARIVSTQLSGFVRDMLHGMAEVLQFSAGPACINRLGMESRQLSQLELSLDICAMRALCATLAVALHTAIVELLLCNRLCGAGALSAVGAVTAVVATICSFAPLTALGGIGLNLQASLEAGERVLEILDTNPAAEEPS